MWSSWTHTPGEGTHKQEVKPQRRGPPLGERCSSPTLGPLALETYTGKTNLHNA